MWNLVLVYLQVVLIWMQDWSMVCAERTMASEIILNEPEVLLVDEAQVEARFGPFGDSANLEARLVHGLRRMYHRLGKHFGHTRWNS
jgi:hypothetical protein